MTRTSSGPGVVFSSAHIADIDTDLLVMPVFEEEDVATRVHGLDAATGGAVARAMTSREVQGRPYELFLTPIVSGWRAARVGLAGAGKAADFNTERLRRLATAAALAARQRRVKRVAFVHHTDLAAAAAVQAITEGLVLANFSGD